MSWLCLNNSSKSKVKILEACQPESSKKTYDSFKRVIERINGVATWIWAECTETQGTVLHLGLSVAGKGNNKEGKGRKRKKDLEWARNGSSYGQEPPCGRGHPMRAVASSNISLCFHKRLEKRE